ncbi:hypothetical protein [Halobacterium jilantaiense]|uniref:Uncharacterized protein n=1 Tax=Halobacterium jilantaiense TaxID=355548 RepID=A0A1I0PY31_9EURY|nr:hypothetical protein [Halobacterium jilantaiense]SEW19541.1 hypothetical protein SAMN04487945_2089 [Halobacterium jilantaiense]
MSGSQQPATDDHGITDADRARIAAYLRTPAHRRSVDDLRRQSE